jgi:hypothetical protein
VFFFLLRLFFDDLRRISIRADDHAHERRHHLFPALVSPGHIDIGIGVIGIVWRIVEVRRDLNSSPLWHPDRLGSFVADLPVEVIMRHTEQSFSMPVGIHGIICHVRAAHMHVRLIPDEVDILVEGKT